MDSRIRIRTKISWIRNTVLNNVPTHKDWQVSQAKLDQQAWAMDKETEAEGMEGEEGRRRQEGAEGDEGRRRQRGHAKTNSVSEKERKIGHRRINEEGQVSHIGKNNLTWH